MTDMDRAFKTLVQHIGINELTPTQMRVVTRAMLAFASPPTGGDVTQGAADMREKIAVRFDEGAAAIHALRHASPFHSVSHDALSTYAANLSGWAREIRYMPLPVPTALATAQAAEGELDGKGKEQWPTSASTADAPCVAAAANAVRASFMTAVSGGKPHPYYLSLAYPTMGALHQAHDALLELGITSARAAAQGVGLLREPTKSAPAGCYCKGTCGAPIIMGRQQPCRRPGGVPGQPAPELQKDHTNER